MDPIAPIAPLLFPRSIAVVGAAASRTKVGGRFVDFLTRAKFPGEIVQVNARRSAEPGILAHLADLDSAVDVAVLAVPRGQIAGALHGAEGKARNLVVVTSGYDESSDELSAEARDDLDALRSLHASGIGVLGPNCNGYYVATSRALVSFAPVFEPLVECPTGSGVAMITQSGAYGARFASACVRHGVPLDAYLNTGNELGYRAGGVLRGLHRNMPEIHTVVMYLESSRDPDVLFESVREATAAGMNVIILCGGTSERGRQSAQSHTAAITPPAKIMRDLLEYAGATVTETDGELFDATVLAASTGPLPPDPRLGLLTISGGVGVIASDRSDARGLTMPPLSSRAQATIAEHLPAFASTTNPVDMTGQPMSDPDYHVKAARSLAESGEIDILLCCIPQAMVPALASAVSDRVTTVAICLDGTTDEQRSLAESGVPAFDSVSRAIDAIANNRKRHHGAILGRPVEIAEPVTGALSVIDALEAFRSNEIPMPEARTVTSLPTARSASAEIGWPVVLKADCDSSVHKLAQQMIELGIVGDDALSGAVQRLRVKADRLSLQQSVPITREFIVGARTTDGLGPVIVIGLGGSLAERLRLIVTLPIDADCPAPPTWMTDGRRLVDAVPEIADNWRQLLGIGRTLGALLDRGGYSEVEANPVALSEGRLLALDARFITEGGHA